MYLLGELSMYELAIQAGGALGVCGLFIAFLIKISASFIKYLENRDEQNQTDRKQAFQYLRDRDSQSKEIAQSGHKALGEITKEISNLSNLLKNRT